MKKSMTILFVVCMTAAAQSTQPLSEFLNPNGTWTSLSSGVNGTVHAIACSGNDVYVGGYFTQAGGIIANNIARWDGTSWSALGSGVDRIVWAIACSGNDVYVGGDFTQAGGTSANAIARWDGTGWSALGSGVSDEVQTIACSGNDVYVGGHFTQAGGIIANNIARWDGSSWSALGSGTDWDVFAIACSGNDVYIGGEFMQAGGISANHIAKWNGTSWSTLGSGIGGGDNSCVNVIVCSGDDVYVGGWFTQAGGAAANNIVRWNGSSWSALGSGVNEIVYTIDSFDNEMYIGGNFTQAGGTPANYIARWNGTGWSTLGSGVNDYVYAAACSGNDVYAGGKFSEAGGIPCSYVAVYHTLEPLPDLIVTNVSVIDADGPDLVHKVTVKNNGTAPTSGKIKTRFYLSQDNTITTSDYLINDWNFTDPLAPGASRTSYDLSSTVSGVPAGEYYMGVITDANNECEESDENNNTLANLVTKVTIPDDGGGQQQPEVILDIPMAAYHPIIDGDMDELWFSVASNPLEKQNTTDASAPDNWLDSFASFKMMVDENNVYMFIQVYDDVINTSHADPWENDSFEFYFDGDNSKNNAATGYDANDVQYRYVYGQVGENTGNAPGSKGRFKNTDHGYNLELHIPANDMTFNLVPDHVFGFEVQFNDNDTGKRDHILKWWSESNNSGQDPSLFGTARTTDYIAACPTIIPEVTGAPVIDGSGADAVWDNVPWFSCNHFTDRANGVLFNPPLDLADVDGCNDCRFNYKLMWQGNMLYFYADVFDDVINTSHNDYWMNDCFQIFIDGNNDKTVSVDANDCEYTFEYSDTPTSDLAFAPTGPGWTVEVQMDLSNEPGITPVVGHLMGLDIKLNDNDTGARDLMSAWWSDDDLTWSTPGVRGTVQFSGEPNTVVHDQIQSIKSFVLMQNYPNPFNPETTIEYVLKEPCQVKLIVINLAGQVVKERIHSYQQPGVYTINVNMQQNPSGIYFYKISMGDFQAVKKMVKIE
ncbi:sugar-binding protein [bacterium]